MSQIEVPGWLIGGCAAYRADAITEKTQREVWGSALLAVGGLVATALSFATGASIVVVFTGAFFGGVAVMAHGLSVRKRTIAGTKRLALLTLVWVKLARF